MTQREGSVHISLTSIVDIAFYIPQIVLVLSPWITCDFQLFPSPGWEPQ